MPEIPTSFEVGGHLGRETGLDQVEEGIFLDTTVAGDLFLGDLYLLIERSM